MSEDVFFSKRLATLIDQKTQIVFVSDLFADDYVGGAELTSQALIDSSPYTVQCVKASSVSMKTLESGVHAYWIFGNFTQLNPQLIPSIIGNLRYSVLEYDYKYCKYRSPQKHFEAEKKYCDCHNNMNGKIVSAFLHGARSIYWMSEKQKEKYETIFPFLSQNDSIVLSSVFASETLGVIKILRNMHRSTVRNGWIVLGSNSWVKGAQAAVDYCTQNSLKFEVVWDLPYTELLEKLSMAEGFVYLPTGYDTCPRMVIEAKLLGCKLILNDNVQHKDEEWFATDDLQQIEEYLYAARGIFWSSIKKYSEYVPSISGYTTTYNCVKQKYPFIQCIESMLAFCDEVCVVDGGSTDGTFEELVNLQKRNVQKASIVPFDSYESELAYLNENSKLKLKRIERDWKSPGFSIFDGMQKAEARAMCTKEFCWQMDSDEVVHEDDCDKIKKLADFMTKETKLISLPVIEYWGSESKVRVDVQPWKWRLSRNEPDITHGVPGDMRVPNPDGTYKTLPGTDGCDMISKSTLERIPHITFYQQEVEKVRIAAMNGSQDALKQYEAWFNGAINALPCVYHYSWFDMERKIKLYRDYWTKHWANLWGMSEDDTSQNNMMFDVPWSQVTDDMIKERAKELSEKLGGWIWHRKWDGVTITPSMKIQRSQPKFMKDAK